MYKHRFKYYKSKAPLPKLNNVIDFNNLKDMSQVKQFNVDGELPFFGLIPPKDWKLFELKEHPGLLCLRNPFTPTGQRYWIVRCLKYYSRKPNKTNLDKYYVLPPDTSWWEYFHSTDVPDLLDKLRWVTFGYHHDWDTKVYSEKSYSTFPKDLGNLCHYLAANLGFSNFKAEAAIVNYYHMDSTLSGHTDHSEDNLEAPLFSFSMNNTRKRKIKTIVSVMLVASALLVEEEEKKEKIIRRWWVKPWLDRKRGNISLSAEMKNVDDIRSYRNYLRMSDELFNILLNKIERHIRKESYTRECITPEEKLIITLRYLATGESFRSLMYNFRIHESTISLFIPTVLKAIYEELKNDYLKVPNTTAEWLQIAREFEDRWNMPNVIGAIDGKHVVIKAPPGAGSAFYNYKDQHSIVLLAMVDANYCFTYINVGINGRISDGGVFWESDLSKALERNWLKFPEDKPLPGRTTPVPHVIVADAAFTLSNYILKPYPFKGLTNEQRIFNYRLSRARRVVENTFGILANRFRVLLTTIPLKPDKATLIVQASCALHNFLQKENRLQYSGSNPEENIDPRYRFVYGLSRQYGKRPKTAALKIREEFKEYVNGCGRVPWQDDVV